jgi:hypothetical protein
MKDNKMAFYDKSAKTWTDMATNLNNNQILQFNAGGETELWMVNIHHEVYMMEDYRSNKFQQIVGQFHFVATAEEGITWAIDDNDKPWRFKAGEISIEDVIENTKHGWSLVNAEGKEYKMVATGYSGRTLVIET